MESRIIVYKKIPQYIQTVISEFFMDITSLKEKND